MDARRQHNHPRRTARWRRQGAQAGGEPLRIVVHWMNDVVVKQFGKDALHDGAVLQHVGNAGRHPQIVFKHVQCALAVAHQVGAANMRPYAMRRIYAHAALPEILRLVDVVGGNHAVMKRLLIVVNVIDKGVQRLHPLLQAAGDVVPLALSDQAGHHVERPGPVDAGGVFAAVNGEGDAHGANGQLGGGLALRKLLVRQSGKHPQQRPGAGTRPARRSDQFIPAGGCVVLLPVDGHCAYCPPSLGLWRKITQFCRWMRDIAPRRAPTQGLGRGAWRGGKWLRLLGSNQRPAD